MIRASSAQVMDQSPSKTGSEVPTIVDVDLGSRSYPIYIGSGLLDQPELLQRFSIFRLCFQSFSLFCWYSEFSIDDFFLALILKLSFC